ncbi:MAG TPA: helix-turn-helix domain-containing protein [Chloroflexota bacterium]|nr:helix-turn-helix domain-containing protein [Chloroflexota bacterium]
MAVAVRGRRTDLKLSQAELARRAGVSRKWISEFEAGKPTTELGLAIHVLEELGLVLDLTGGEDAASSIFGRIGDLAPALITGERVNGEDAAEARRYSDPGPARRYTRPVPYSASRD